MRIRQNLMMAVLLLLTPSLHAQLTLDDCKQKAHDNYPLVKQYELLNLSCDYTLDNISKTWLPQVSVTGGTTAYTDILNLPSQAQALAGDTKNWVAGAGVSVQQQIYDGGQTTARQQVTRAETEVSHRSVDVSMYAINDRVEQLFFGILLLDEQLKQNRLLHQDLGVNERQVSDLIKGGLANSTDLDAVKVEEVRCRQNEAALMSSRQAYLRMLGYFTGMTLGDSTRLATPVETAEADTARVAGRPELQWYAARLSLLDWKRKQLDTRLRPTLGAFGTAMTHTSLSDMMHNSFAAVGLTVNWNIGALYTRKNDLRQLQTEADRINVERQTFLFNNRLQSEETRVKTDGLRRQLDLDNQAVTLREHIYAKSMTKVKLGTETVNEMLRDAIAVSQARQQQSLHRIQLLQTIYQQKNILGQ